MEGIGGSWVSGIEVRCGSQLSTEGVTEGVSCWDKEVIKRGEECFTGKLRGVGDMIEANSTPAIGLKEEAQWIVRQLHPASLPLPDSKHSLQAEEPLAR